jgi:mRNA interferase MazF
MTGLPRDSVANVTQLVSLDKGTLVDRVGTIPEPKLDLILEGIGIVLGHR